MGVAAQPKPTVVFLKLVLKVNKKMGAGSLLSGHPSFTVLCQIDMFILLSGGKE